MGLVLRELVTAAPPDGDSITYLARALDHPVDEVRAAVDQLVADGLATHDGERVRATSAAITADKISARS